MNKRISGVSKILIFALIWIFCMIMYSNAQAYTYYYNGYGYVPYSYQNYYEYPSNTTSRYIVYPYQNFARGDTYHFEDGYITYPNELVYEQNTQNGSSGSSERSVVNNYYYQTTTNTSSSTKNSTSSATQNSTDTNTSANTKSNVSNENNIDMNNLPSVTKVSNRASDSNLPALALKGKGTFMPSSIWQWILFVVLILIVIILIRVVTKKPDSHNGHHMAPAH